MTDINDMSNEQLVERFRELGGVMKPDRFKSLAIGRAKVIEQECKDLQKSDADAYKVAATHRESGGVTIPVTKLRTLTQDESDDIDATATFEAVNAARERQGDTPLTRQAYDNQ